jgi:hypothetical protein
VLIVGFVCATDAEADWYSCRDAHGKPLRGQSEPEGCVGEICRTNPATGARVCAPPPETAEQRKKREVVEQQRRQCEKMAHTQRLGDLRFLDRYWSDDVIEEERNRALAQQRMRIGDAGKRLDELRTERSKLDRETEFFGPKHPMPAQLKSEIESSTQLLDTQGRDLDLLVDGMRRINERYDALLARRRDLLEKGSAPVACDKALAQ